MFWHNNQSIFLGNSVSTILVACKSVGKLIARFCYHEQLPVAGNCRACLVELQNFDKPTAACVAELEFDQSVWTESVFSKKARENVFELLLINHPLDCPICDQGGECDLQDQSKVFGSLSSRYFFKKRSIFDKHCDFLIKTIMTRCIHCTRCVRFNNVISNGKIGILNRGTASTIGNYFFRNLQSNLLANVIDLCPVGALTSRINAFTSRPWEVTLKDGLDLADGVGSTVYFGIKDLSILKVLPKPNKSLNGNLITDTCRFFFKQIKTARLNNLQFLNKTTLNYNTLRWPTFFKQLDTLQRSFNFIFILINQKLNQFTVSFLKKLNNRLGNKIKFITNSVNAKQNVYFSSAAVSIGSLDKQINNCFLYSYLDSENNILNLKLKLKYQKSLLTILCSGVVFSEGFNSFGILNLKAFTKKIKAKTSYSAIFLFGLFSFSIISRGFSSRTNYFKSISYAQKRQVYTHKFSNTTTFCNEEGFTLLHVSSSFLKPQEDSIFFCISSADSLYLRKNIITKNKHIIWFHSYKPLFGNFLYLVPVSSFFEETGLYINLEQKAQVFNKILNSNFKHKSFSTILASIFKLSFGENLKLKTLVFKPQQHSLLKYSFVDPVSVLGYGIFTVIFGLIMVDIGTGWTAGLSATADNTEAVIEAATNKAFIIGPDQMAAAVNFTSDRTSTILILPESYNESATLLTCVFVDGLALNIFTAVIYGVYFSTAATMQIIETMPMGY